MSNNRRYLRSHPWLKFAVDLRRVDAGTWMKLGECASKIDHVANVALPPEVARELSTVYLTKGALATAAIEGNTLTEDEAREVIEGRSQLPPSREYLANELTNVVDACNQLLDQMKSGESASITFEKLCWMNQAVLRNLSVDEGVVPGVIRRHEVTVGRYRGAPAEDLPFLMEKYAEFINGFPVIEGQPTASAIIKAVIAHLYLAWIHPFGDGNGRTSRLLELLILLGAGIPQPSTHLLSNHYNKTRSNYYRQLDLAQKPGAGPLDFLAYAVEGYLDGLVEQLEKINSVQNGTAWVNFIYDSFRSAKRKGPAQRRKRELILALSEYPEGVDRKKIKTLTPKLAVEYNDLTSKAISRDINELEKMRLVTRKGKTIYPNSQVILSFMPWRKNNA